MLLGVGAYNNPVLTVLLSGKEAVALPCFVPAFSQPFQKAFTVPPAQTTLHQEEYKLLHWAKTYYSIISEKDYSRKHYAVTVRQNYQELDYRG